jgi:hypothetical protein
MLLTLSLLLGWAQPCSTTVVPAGKVMSLLLPAEPYRLSQRLADDVSCRPWYIARRLQSLLLPELWCADGCVFDGFDTKTNTAPDHWSRWHWLLHDIVQ